MTDRDRDDFLAWVKSTLYEAELAFSTATRPHAGRSGPQRPVSILGALRDAYGQHEVDEGFIFLRGGCGETGKGAAFRPARHSRQTGPHAQAPDDRR